MATQKSDAIPATDPQTTTRATASEPRRGTKAEAKTKDKAEQPKKAKRVSVAKVRKAARKTKAKGDDKPLKANGKTYIYTSYEIEAAQSGGKYEPVTPVQRSKTVALAVAKKLERAGSKVRVFRNVHFGKQPRTAIYPATA